MKSQGAYIVPFRRVEVFLVRIVIALDTQADRKFIRFAWKDGTALITASTNHHDSVMVALFFKHFLFFLGRPMQTAFTTSPTFVQAGIVLLTANDLLLFYFHW